MSVFVLGPDDEKRLREALAKARQTPVTLDMLKVVAGATTIKDGVVSGDRLKGVPEPQEVDLPLGWRVNISVEQQPFGPCLHISMSSPRSKNRLPRPEAMQMVLEALGGYELKNALNVWVEDFKEAGRYAGRAVNAVLPLTSTPPR